MLYRLAYFLILLGALGWVYSIFYQEGNPSYQLISIAIVTLGIFIGHLWEELFRDKEKQ